MESNTIIDDINFGVIIRSISERTENICYESCEKAIPKENIHLVKNIYPSFRAHIKTFEIAINHKYDWFS